MTDSRRPPRILKFGGSTVGSRERINVAVRMVRAAGPSVRAVVVSAPGDLTDHILELTGDPADRPDEHRIAGALAHGELLGAAVFVRALQAQGIEARLLRPDDANWPIITDDQPLRARVNVALSRARVQRLVSAPTGEPIWVVPGCVGVTADGERWTSLGRGGGDTTAVALARCFDEAEVLLVKDVPGVLAADPRAIPDAEVLEELTVEEMAVLARGGSAVVAPSALEQLGPGTLLRVIGLGTSTELPNGTVIRSASRDPSDPAEPGETQPVSARSAGDRAASWVVVTALPRTPDAPTSRSVRPAPGPGGPLEEDRPGPLTLVVPEGDADTVVRHLHRAGVVRATASRPLGTFRTSPPPGPRTVVGRAPERLEEIEPPLHRVPGATPRMPLPAPEGSSA
ncbi:MAG: hypothetical protein L3K03_01495 [Thermoplasmata archaeon]|nr:hypothetical protein [Thermoplasmata archaeon]